MKQKLLSTMLVLTGILIIHPRSVFAQSTTDTRNAIANIFAIGEAAKAAKLQRQNAALKKIKEIFDGLQNGGSAQEALDNSVQAMEAYPKFSTPYLLGAYASLQLNNPLNAHRFLVLYDRVARKAENREINKDVPQSFVDQIRKQTNAEYSKYSAADIERLSASEGWLDQTVDLGIDVALRGIFAGDEDEGAENPGEFDLENRLALSYHKYLWFNKHKTFSTFGTKNFGIDFNAGVDVKINILNSSYYPSRELVFFQPGIFLGRWYIAPFKVQVTKLNGYSGSAADVGYQFTPVGSKYTTFGSISSETNPPVIPFPEIRYYTNFISGYAYDHKKNPKPLTRWDNSYIYFKWTDEIYSGKNTGLNTAYYGEQGEGILGAQFAASATGNFTLGLYIGFGTLVVKKLEQSGTTMKANSVLDDTFFKSGISIKIRLY